MTKSMDSDEDADVDKRFSNKSIHSDSDSILDLPLLTGLFSICFSFALNARRSFNRNLFMNLFCEVEPSS
jgi:hypothetical protein